MGLPGLAYLTGIADAGWTAIGLAIGTYLKLENCCKENSVGLRTCGGQFDYIAIILQQPFPGRDRRSVTVDRCDFHR